MILRAMAAAIFTMATMHEYMHQWAQQKNEIRQCPHDMGLMLGPQEKAGYHDENHQSCMGKSWCRKNAFII